MDNITLEDKYLTELLKFYRVQRHDFLNHFQVAMGYIQLGKGERALEYLKRAAEAATEEAAISKLSTPELAVELMKLNTECFNLGIEFHCTVAEDLPPLDWCSTYAAGMDILRKEVQDASGLELLLNSGEQGLILSVKFAGVGREKTDMVTAKFLALDLPAQVSKFSGEPILEVHLNK